MIWILHGNIVTKCNIWWCFLEFNFNVSMIVVNWWYFSDDEIDDNLIELGKVSTK